MYMGSHYGFDQFSVSDAYLQFMTTRLWFIGCIYRLLSSKNFHLSFTLHFAFFFFVVVEKLGLVFEQTCT